MSQQQLAKGKLINIEDVQWIDDDGYIDEFKDNEHDDGHQFGYEAQSNQHYHISPLDEIEETEFQNKDFIQEITVNGFVSKKNNQFKYDFLLSEVSMFTTPPVKDCLKIQVPKNIRQFLAEEGYQQQYGKPVCTALSMNHFATGLTKPYVIIWELNTEEEQENYIQIPQDFQAPSALSFSVDGLKLMVGSISGEIGLIDVMKLQFTNRFSEIHFHRIIALKIIYTSSDYQTIITASSDTDCKNLITYYKKGIIFHDKQSQSMTKNNKVPINTIEVLNSDIKQRFIHQSQTDPPGCERFYLGLMSNEILQIICVRKKENEPPEITTLYEFQNPSINEYYHKFCSSLTLGHGYMKRHNSNEFEDSLLIIFSWGYSLYFLEYQEHKTTWDWPQLIIESQNRENPINRYFTQSKAFVSNSLILSVKYMDTSLFQVITHQKGLFLVNTTNLRYFKEEKTFFDLKALNFSDTRIKINYNSTIYESYKGRKAALARQAFKRTVYNIIKQQKQSKSLIQAYNYLLEEIIEEDYSQFFSSCYSQGKFKSCVLTQNAAVFTMEQDWRVLLGYYYDQLEWLQGMQYIVSIYKGTNIFVTSLLNLEKEEKQNLLSASISDVALKYHKMIMEGMKDVKKEVENDNLILKQEQQDRQLFSERNDQNTFDKVQFTLEKIQNDQRTLLSILIEFLLLTDSYKILFEQIMRQTEEYLLDHNEFFLSCLQQFYLKKLVKQIPTRELIIIIDFYKQRQDAGLIQKLVYSLDHNKIESGRLLAICLKCGLLKSLALICEKGDPQQFLTPLMQLWCHILNYIQRSEFEYAQYFVLRLLAYTKMILKKKFLQGQDIPQKQFEGIITLIINWMLQETNLIRIIMLEPAPAFEILFLFFNPEIQVIFEENVQIDKDLQNAEQDFLNESSKSNRLKALMIINQIVSQILDDQNKIDVIQDYRRVSNAVRPKQLSTGRSQSISKNPNIKSKETDLDFNENNGLISLEQKDVDLYFVLFQLRLYMNNYMQIRKERILKCVEYILRNMRALNFLYLRELFVANQAEKKQNLKQWKNQIEILQFLRSEYIVRVLQKVTEDDVTQKLMKTIQNLSNIAEQEVKTVCIFLAEYRKEYKRAFDYYLQNDNKYINSKIFSWLWPTMLRLEGSNDENEQIQFQIIRDQLLIRLTDLVKINSQQTRDLINKYNKNTEQEVISKLDSVPALQLEYVENVLKKDREEQKKSDKEMLIRNIKLLLKLKPHKIIDELREYDYPLDQVLMILKENRFNNQNHIIAYVLERLGQIVEAVQLRIYEFENHVDQYCKEIQYEFDLFTKLGQNSTSVSSLFSKSKQNMADGYEAKKIRVHEDLVFTIQNIIQVCQQNNDNSDEIWYMLLDSLIKVKDQKVNNSQALSFIANICIDKMCEIIIHIAKTRDMDKLLEQLQYRYSHIDLGQIKNSFIEIFSNYGYIENSFTSSQTLLKFDIMATIFKIVRKFKNGIISRGTCSECQTDVYLESIYHSDTNDVILFKCGHSYHRGCTVEQKGTYICQICCTKDETYAYNLLFLNSKIQLDKLTESLKKKQQSTNEMNEENEEKNHESKYHELMNGGDGLPKQQLSKAVQQKRTRRTNKMRFFDRKKDEHILLVDKSRTELIDADLQYERKFQSK